jgi:hypothetical protein
MLYPISAVELTVEKKRKMNSYVIFPPQRKTVAVAGQELNKNKKTASPVDIRASLRVLGRVTCEKQFVWFKLF